MKCKYLNRPFEIKAVEETGVFEGYGSVFGVLDSYNEVVAQGAFQTSLAAWKSKGRMPSLLWQHRSSEPAGVYLEMREDNKGLYVKGQLALKTARGSEAYELLKLNALSGLSIGYREVRVEEDKGTRIITLKELDLWEVSLVTFPSNDEARVGVVKEIIRDGDVPTAREMEEFLRDAGFSRAQAKAFIADGYKGLNQRDAENADTSSLLKSIEQAAAKLRQ